MVAFVEKDVLAGVTERLTEQAPLCIRFADRATASEPKYDRKCIVRRPAATGRRIPVEQIHLEIGLPSRVEGRRISPPP